MITGHVDDDGRALIPITVAHPLTGLSSQLEVWIDTGFTGGLMLTQEQIAKLNLPRTANVEGVLADGSTTSLRSCLCRMDWFGRSRSVHALATSGSFPLLGVRLLENLELLIDYAAHTVTLKPRTSV